MTAPLTNATLPARLESVIGSVSVLADPADCAAYAVDGIIPSAVAKITSSEQIREIVRFTASEKLALLPTGARTKLAIGWPPIRYEVALDMTGLNQIAHYDSADLTLSVDAGMPIAELNATLAQRGQFLPLLVPFYSASTVGGIIASGIDSPLRQFYGTARDFLMGAEFVDGAGKLCKSGGRVVKNVTGYDLHKLLIGSLGTLAVITRLNFRTFPAPITGSRGFVASFATAEGALALRRAIAQTSLAPLTLDVVSPELAKIFASRAPSAPEISVFAGERLSPQASLAPIGEWFRPREWQLCAAFAGAPEVLERYARDLTRMAQDAGATSTAVLDDNTRPSVWGRLREALAMLLESSPAAVVFKLGLLPAQHASAIMKLREIAERASIPHAQVACAAGPVFFALLPTTPVLVGSEHSQEWLCHCAAQIFESVSASKGQASVLFAPTAVKESLRALDVSSSQRTGASNPDRTDRGLMRRLKSAFDPQSIFARGHLFNHGGRL
jgi:glycolate oxidase FAD binding subunit